MKNQLLIFVITLVIPLLMPELSYAGCREYVAGHCYRCYPGEWLYGSGCQPCPANATCNNGQTYTCNSGYYTFGPPGCEPCPANATCSGTSTVTCKSGYYRSAYNKCSPCPANATCPNGSIVCNNGYQLENSTCVKGCPDGCAVCNGSTCNKCESNKFLYSNICFDCDTSTMICNGGALTCKNGYYKYGPPDCYACPENATCISPGTLTCNKGYYQSSYNKCSPCSKNCTSCTSSGSCTACAGGYILENGKCVCPKNTIDRGGCYACPVFGICDGTSTFTCKDGYYSFGYPTCFACPVGATCNKQTDSFTCNEGYYRSDIAACSRCPTGCKTCIDVSGSCTACSDGYNLENGECVLAQTVNTCPSRMTLSSDGCCCLNK